MADADGVSVNGLVEGPEEEARAAAAELQEHRIRNVAAEDENSRLLLEKIDAEADKKRAHKDLENFMASQDKLDRQFNEEMNVLQEELKNLDRVNQDIKDELNSLRQKLLVRRSETKSLQQQFKIEAELPVKRVKFTHTQAEGDEHVSSVFTVIQRPWLRLTGGQALVSFEEEDVARQILRLDRCSVTAGVVKMDVKPHAFTLEPSVKFQVHVKVSKTVVDFHNVPPTFPEERMRERLQLLLSRPSVGGGEVKELQYDGKTGSGSATFLQTGVVEQLVGRRVPEIPGAVAGVQMELRSHYDYLLKKFQTFSGTPNRTVLLGGIQDVMDEEDLQDQLEIHFQKPSNHGGEVESVCYVPAGKELLCFFSEE